MIQISVCMIFFATMFHGLGNEKIFHVGRCISIDPLKSKYLERFGRKNKYLYDWPVRDDVSIGSEDPQHVVKMVKFNGLPPFSLTENEVKDILNTMLSKDEILTVKYDCNIG